MKLNWKQAAVLVAGGALIATSFAFADSTSTTPNPLSVSCSATVSANVITWTATAAGGTAPYTFAWSGDGVAGATSTTVTATYLSNGTRTVSVMATDSATTTRATVTNSCSATVSSIVATSTPPAPFMNHPTLSVNGNGEFLGRGMKVTSVGTNSFQAQVWGITYTVNWSGNLQAAFEFLFRTGIVATSSPTQQLAVGDEVGVSGKIDPSSPFTIAANVVRDYSIVTPRMHGNDKEGEGKGKGVQILPPIFFNASGSAAASGSVDVMSRLKDLLKQLQGLQNLFHDRGNGGGNGNGQSDGGN